MTDNTNNIIVTDIIEKNSILTRLLNNHCQVEVKQTTHNGTFKTIGISEILKVDTENNLLLFDAINHNSIKENSLFKIFSKHNGIDINFKIIVSDTMKRNNLNYFHTNIPEEIIYKQRRQQYRVELQNLWKIPVTLINKNDQPLTAYIYNISAGGMKVRSSTENFIKIKQNSVIDTLIQLPNNANVQCKLQVRQTQSNKLAGFQQLAGQFINLNAKQERTLQSFVNSVERNIIKTNSQLHAI